MQSTSFQNWMQEVDRILADRLGGLVSADLPDVDYRGLYATGDSPPEAARYAVEQEDPLLASAMFDGLEE